MERLTTIDAVRRWHAAASGSLGFVPTMGALHDGHLSLVRRSTAENDRTIVSIFVNPLQFGPDEDLGRYPRDLDGDCSELDAAGVDAVFFPEAAELYPDAFSTTVEVRGPLTERLEGASRPGHFAGVTTVVTKLMQIAQATRTYFGMKDAQQLLVLAKLVRDLAIPTTVVPVVTVREGDGLAMSSRNRYLDAADRAAAAVIPRALDAGAAAYDRGERAGTTIADAVRAVLAAESRLAVEYVSCASIDTLAELGHIDDVTLLLLAVDVGGTHLIDNRWLGLDLDAGAALPPALRSTY